MKQYYTFDDPQQAIRFDRFDLPSPWINYLSNGRMHAFVSQAGGGMTWWLTPMLFRVSRYRFYNLPIDSPGFYPGHVQHGVKPMTVNGKQVNGAYIKEELLGDCNEAQVHIVMG